MAAVTGSVLRWRDRLVALSVLEQDALLYLLATIFASGTIVLAASDDYRQWAEMALGPYVIAAVIAWWVSRRRPARRPGDRRGRRPFSPLSRARVCSSPSCLCPLPSRWCCALESKPGAHVQNEVTVIEACADRVAHHKNCYLSNPKSIGTSVTSQSENSFFPYLPGMIPFGLVNATSGPPEFKDARLPLTGFSLIVIAGALLIAETTSKRRWRIFQVVVILPSGALPMVTGGDDLPVIALMLLGLALATRRRPVWSGLAMGLAGTLKFTAWPLLILLVLGEWDRQGRRAVWRYSLAAAAVVVPVLGVGVGLAPHAFILNAIRFPLGLTKVKSPAASPLLGQELVTLFPAAKPELITILALIGLGAVGYGLLKWLPSSPRARPASVARHAASHTSRPGNALRVPHLPARLADLGRAAGPMSPHNRGRVRWVLIGFKNRRRGPRTAEVSDPITGEVCPSPASEGEIEGLTVVTTTPTSHS